MINKQILNKMKIKEDTFVTPYLKTLSIENGIRTDDSNDNILFEVSMLEDLEHLSSLLNRSIDQKIWLIFVKPIHKDAVVYRDHPFTPIAEKGYETVAQISINERFSALRFRHLNYIKKLNRQDKHKITLR